ncbi:multidrug resistance protein MdtO [Methylopila capsulata]|uniref:Multidrug resistance protein MdtO n=1 Tax=Methylopila capsulata TaxID=61654 RepID=A0A9W6IPW2_9HYPH|nr:FUSC family protein [Methylopila capsulata]MBM7851274.1 multidrug resistance protein MdtO [Methylopila capsulata]GLK54332.1 hypothetical protein GCM10008170_03510 [Methylopila capsulata]
MAPAAASRGYIRDLLGDALRPDPGRFAQAMKLAAGCSCTVLLAMIYEVPEPSLAAYIVFFLNKPDRTTSVVLALGGVVVVSAVLGLMFPITNAVIDDPALRVAAMSAISLAVLFLGAASKLAKIAPIVSLIVAYALTLLGAAQSGELATRAFLYAWLFVALPAAATIVVNLLFGASPRRLVEQEIGDRLRTSSGVLRGDPDARRNLRRKLIQGDAGLRKNVKLARLERTSEPGELDALTRAASASVELVALADTADRPSMAESEGRSREALAATLDDLAAVYERGDSLADISAKPAVEGSLCSKPLAALRELVLRFGHDDAAPDQPAEKKGFFASDIFDNPAYAAYAVTTTLAAMTCYLIYSALDWSGIHTAMITCYIVSLGTIGQSVEKLTLRIIGAVIGASAGMLTIVLITPHLSSIGGLLGLVFASAFVSAWLAVGSERVSYIGFQMAFALFICELQGSGPGYDMIDARDRVIGILIGNLVFFLFATRLWPVSVGKQLDDALALAARCLAKLATATSPGDRRAALSAGQSAFGKATDALTLLRYEPDSVRPNTFWIDRNAQALDDLEHLQGPLALATQRDPSHEWSMRLEAIAAEAAAHIDPGARNGEAQPLPESVANRDVTAEVDSGLKRLEQRFRLSWIDDAAGAGYAGA